MKIKFFVILIALALLAGSSIAYLNKVVLPVKVKSWIIRTLESETGKKVSFSSLQLNVFRGLVVKELAIADGTKTILSVKEATCTWLIPAIFKRQFIIPSVRLDSARIFLERRADNTFNLQDLFLKKAAQSAKANFGVFIYKIVLTDSRVDFRDSALSAPFNKSIEKLNLALYLSLPASVKFNLKSEIPAATPLKINATGEFRIPENKLSAEVRFKDISPEEFAPYYHDYGITIPSGTIDASIGLIFKDGQLLAGLTAQNRDLAIARDGLNLKLNAGVKADFKYGLKDRQFLYSGSADISQAEVSGIEPAGRIEEIKGRVKFNNDGLSSESLSAKVFGIPLEAKIRLADFSSPVMSADVSAKSLSLALLQKIVKEKSGVTFPGDLRGGGDLFFTAETKLPLNNAVRINGYLDVTKGAIKLDKLSFPFEDIQGRLEFSQNQVRWPALKFRYQDTFYQASGVLTDFRAPAVEIKLSSPEILLQSSFTVNNNLINLKELSGKYLNSEFTAGGNIDNTEPAHPQLDINASVNVDLRDIKEPLKKYKEKLEQAKLAGKVSAKIKIKGDAADIKSCLVQAEVSSGSISAYGLESGGLSFDYQQEEGVASIPLMRLLLYEGVVSGSARMNLNAQNFPFWIEINIEGVKIEKLKLDTVAKDKDISGAVKAEVKINGFSGDLSKLSGLGNIFITEGRLWQLNLFKGLGELLFSKDFSNIIFSQGQCSFTVRDKSVFTDNLKLKSNLANLKGSAKIGFDGSLDSSLNIEVLDESAPASGTFKDVATAIIGQAGRFGIVRITGTLERPQYKFKPAVVDILKGIKDAIFGAPAE